jgi:hypothetical protein
MKNKTEIIVYSTTVSQYHQAFAKPYFIRVEGMFKSKREKDFHFGHFTVELFIENDDRGTWSTHGQEGDTFSFFNLSPSKKPSERAKFLHYCLKKKQVLEQIQKDFGEDSAIFKWILEECPITYSDSK